MGKRPWRKLTNEEVEAIHASTELGKVLAYKYGVSQAMISAIRNGKRRTKTLPPKPPKLFAE